MTHECFRCDLEDCDCGEDTTQECKGCVECQVEMEQEDEDDETGELFDDEG